MAKLKQARPSLVGQTQTVQRDVRMVRMPNAYEGLGRSAANMIRGGVKLGSVIGGIMEERNEIDYRRTFNEAVAEVDSRMQKEVFEKTGLGAEGASARTSAIYGEVFGKYSGRLSGRNKQRFEEAWGSRRNGQMPSVMQFEYKQLTGAQLALNKTTQESAVAHYASTGAETDLAPAMEAFDSSYRIQNGGRLINRESVRKFDADLNDNDGFITLIDGRKLRIVDEVKEGEKDAISRTEVNKLREKLNTAAEHYESGRQQLLDTAHAGIVTKWMQAGDFAAAKSYMENTRLPMSASARGSLNDAIKRRSEAADDFTFAVDSVTGLEKVGGKYGSTKQDEEYRKLTGGITEKYKGNPEKARRLLASLELNYNQLQNRQKAQLASDVAAEAATWEKLSDVEKELKVRSLPDGRLKSSLHKLLVADLKSRGAKPGSAAVMQSRANITAALAGAGTRTVDGVQYDMSKPDQVRALMLASELPAKDRIAAVQAAAKFNVGQAVSILAQKLGYDPHTDEGREKALRAYPSLIFDINYALGDVKPADMNAWLDVNIPKLLTQQLTNYNALWFNTADDMADYMGKGSRNRSGELFFTTEQAEQARAILNDIRKETNKNAELDNGNIFDFMTKRGFGRVSEGVSNETRFYVDNED